MKIDASDELLFRLDFKFSLSFDDQLSESSYAEDIDAEIRAERVGEGGSSGEDFRVGTMQLVVVDISKAQLDGQSNEDLAFDLDCIEADLGGFALEVLVRLEELEEVYSDTLFFRILLVKRIEVVQEYRGRGIGSKAIGVILNASFLNCDLVAVKPFGIEEERIHPSDNPELKQLKRQRFRLAETRLIKFYQRLGFRHLLPDHMTYAPALRRQPSIVAARRFLKTYNAKR